MQGGKMAVWLTKESAKAAGKSRDVFGPDTRPGAGGSTGRHLECAAKVHSATLLCKLCSAHKYSDMQTFIWLCVSHSHAAQLHVSFNDAQMALRC